MGGPRELFISHASGDHAFAGELSEILTRHGLPHWYSRTGIMGAQQWHDEIGVALRRCDWFVVVPSPSAVASMWVKRELLFALQQNRIGPLLLEPCDTDELSWVLSSFQIIDFTSGTEAGYRELLRIWGLAY